MWWDETRRNGMRRRPDRSVWPSDCSVWNSGWSVKLCVHFLTFCLCFQLMIMERSGFCRLSLFIYCMYCAVNRRLKISCTGVAFFVEKHEVLFKTSAAKLLLGIILLVSCIAAAVSRESSNSRKEKLQLHTQSMAIESWIEYLSRSFKCVPQMNWRCLTCINAMQMSAMCTAKHTENTRTDFEIFGFIVYILIVLLLVQKYNSLKVQWK